jgi:plasmid maintenance system antidote protein VapI
MTLTSRVNDIVLGRRRRQAFRLAFYFGTSADFRINLQTRYDLNAAENCGPAYGCLAGLIA